MLFHQFLKTAGYCNYDPRKQLGTGKTPPKLKMTLSVVAPEKDDPRKVKIPGGQWTDIPKWGKNSESPDKWEFTEGTRRSMTRNSVSGTGFGRALWREPKNGYGL